jgi:hypothetical protein
MQRDVCSLCGCLDLYIVCISVDPRARYLSVTWLGFLKDVAVLVRLV